MVDLDHSTTGQYVKIGEAAKLAGVPYQYIYGMAHRNLNRKRTNIHVTIVDPVSTWGPQKPTILVCKTCILDHYGLDAPGSESDSVLRATPIVAFRTWNIGRGSEANMILSTSYSEHFVWMPDGSQAKCSKNHQVPNRKCTCGLYALNHVPSKNERYGNIVGAVELWGHYREGEKAGVTGGWRAEWGRPIALLCDNCGWADQIHITAELYRIPVTHSSKLLGKIRWDEETESYVFGKEGEENGYWRGEEVGGSFAEAETRRGISGIGTGKAPCRRAAEGARTIEDLKRLLRDRVISYSNALEILEGR